MREGFSLEFLGSTTLPILRFWIASLLTRAKINTCCLRSLWYFITVALASSHTSFL